MTEIETHQDAYLQAFSCVLRAEEAERVAKTELTEATNRLKPLIAQAETEQALAWADIAALMAQTGEVEVALPDVASDFRIGWQAGRESVKADPAATPDEFVKIERKPMLKEIGDHLRALREAGQSLPNWASLEKGERKLGYRIVKRGAK